MSLLLTLSTVLPPTLSRIDNTRYCPQGMQRVNSSTTLGQIVILHRPLRVPLRHPGRYQLVVACAADTK